LELYTSQGCHSCPPAESWFNTLTNHKLLWDEVVPVAFHVDYWDYLGWEDPFATSSHSQRQRSYARATGMGVYTPGFVMNGAEWRDFFEYRGRPKIRASKTSDEDLENETSSAGNLSITVDGDVVTATYVGGDNGTETKGKLILNLALMGFDLETSIPRGENAGRTIDHDFVVLDYQQSSSKNGQWSGKLPLQKVEGEKFALAAWVSKSSSPLPLQATGGWL